MSSPQQKAIIAVQVLDPSGCLPSHLWSEYGSGLRLLHADPLHPLWRHSPGLSRHNLENQREPARALWRRRVQKRSKQKLEETGRIGPRLGRECSTHSPGESKDWSATSKSVSNRFGYSMITLAICLWTVSWIFVTCLNLAAARQVSIFCPFANIAHHLSKYFPRFFASDANSCATC